MFLTKSILNEFLQCPKYAWFHIHNKDIYKKISKKQYGSIDGLAIGQSVEDVVKMFLKWKKIISPDLTQIKFYDWHNSFHKLTEEIIKKNPDVVYQPGFVVGDLFTKSDFLVKNNDWKYDLWEVKSKNSIRKKNNGEKLLEELNFDISFQKYVLKKCLWNKFSGECFLVYLNKEYVRNGEIIAENLLKIENVTKELLEDKEIEWMTNILREYLPMDQENFEIAFPYNGENHLMYFGTKKPKNSIWMIPRIGKKIIDFYPDKLQIQKLSNLDIALLLNSKGEETKSTEFIKLWKQWKTIINQKEIKKRFDENLKFPLYFYDYETISRPVPLFEKTHPWQQVVVQYSLHKVENNWQITHKEAIINHWALDNKNVIDQLVRDLDGETWTYIVRYKWFENTRNEEMMELYPEYKSFFEKVNNNTFDLMEIFDEQLYFDREFGWSSSIKKVLPVLTKISYDNMLVWNGSLASELLRKLLKNELKDKQSQVRKNLLEYCKQDTWAMVRIWEEVNKKL